MFLWQTTKPANRLFKGGLRAFFFFSLSNRGHGNRMKQIFYKTEIEQQ
jgi:hypothetical protein